MRILIVCSCPLKVELGAAQVHLNLATGLRGLGHTVQLWSPYPMRDVHWATVVHEMRAKLGVFLSSCDTFDVIDCPPVLMRGRFVNATPSDVTWIARSVQPDMLYLWEGVHGHVGASVGAWARRAALATWSAGIAALVYRGWSVSTFVMCFGLTERAWVWAHFPWLRSKLRSYDGAISDSDRIELARVRGARQPNRGDGPVRYIWIGRWIEHKGVDTLLRFLRERLAEGTNEEFTIAGCGPAGVRALAPLVGSERVRVIEGFTRSELPGILAAHDAGLFTSRAEGWGLVLNEMVESGLPVYATSAGGVDDIRSVLGPFIQNFPPPRGAAPPPLPGQEAQARYEARFRWQAIAERYVDSISSPI